MFHSIRNGYPLNYAVMQTLNQGNFAAFQALKSFHDKMNFMEM
jgi:hypothetical protein